MDEAWERAVETALGSQSNTSAGSPPRSLTLDGAVKCLHGKLPPPEILERFQSLEHLSIANIGVSSLEKFPRLRNLTRLILSDNRIAGGLEFLVEAGLDALRDLDLSNNRIQFVEDLAPLAQMRLVSLDLYECPVTRIKDYRSRVFSMIRTLKYLDKMDADENERPETDDEDEEEEDEEDDEEEEEDPGSGEVDGDDRAGRSVNGASGSPRGDGILDVDEDEESDADEEETEIGGRMEVNGSLNGSHLSNGFRVAAARPASADGEEEDEDEEEDVEDGDDEDDDDDDDDDPDLGEEIDEEEVEEEDVVEVHDIADSEEDRDGVEEEGEEEVDEEDDDEDDNGDGEEDEEDLENEEGREPGSTGRTMTTAEEEIDGHEQGEEDENGEIGEEDEQGVEEDREYQEDGEDDDEV